MSKKAIRLSILGTVFALCVILGTTFYMNNTILARSPHPTKMAPQATITIVHKQELFSPFLVAVQPKTTVTWKNEDTLTHVFLTTPQKSIFLNPQPFSLRVAPGKSVTFTFTQPGMYHYYDTTMSTWNTAFSRVSAKKGTPRFPLAMDGILWVRGAINNLPLASVNQISAGHDEFISEFLAINQYGTISWHNFDSDAHILGLVPGWTAPVNPTDIGLYRIAGTNDVPGGDTVTVSFSTPGLYYYYCKNHVDIDPATHRAQAIPMASEYPLPMEGFVLVV